MFNCYYRLITIDRSQLFKLPRMRGRTLMGV